MRWLVTVALAGCVTENPSLDASVDPDPDGAVVQTDGATFSPDVAAPDGAMADARAPIPDGAVADAARPDVRLADMMAVADGAVAADARAPQPDGAVDLDGAVGRDVDGDGIPDADDNCPRAANRGQADRDEDGVGDLCDPCPDVPDEAGGGPGGCDPVGAVMLCGRSERPVERFLRGDVEGLEVRMGCEPGADVQALLVSRNGAQQLAAEVLRAYLRGGGQVVGEYSINHLLYNRAFEAEQPQGRRFGSCRDSVQPVVRHRAGDPFWRANAFEGVADNASGCGFDLRHLPNVTPLGGWTADSVSLGYRDLGAGRLWLVEADWQDQRPQDFSDASADLMASMIGGGFPARADRAACADGSDNDDDGATDGDDLNCTGPADDDEGGPVLGDAPACHNDRDDDRDGRVDWPADPGCAARGDDDERDPNRDPACANGRDDDDDGEVDWPADEGCDARGADCEQAGHIRCGDRCVDPQADRAHCGRCDRTCGPDVACVDGACGEWAFEGIRDDLTADDLEDWQPCHTDTYRDTTPLRDVQANCQGAHLLLACRHEDADRYAVAAMGDRNEVFQETEGNETHEHNGVAWYYSTDASLGFTAPGTEVRRATCDTSNERPAQRLCWHTSNGNLNPGWRCGAQTGLNGAAGWQRHIFQRP